MPGPAPKPNRRRRNADTFTPDTVITGGYAPAPELPSRDTYDPRTLAWWDTWVASPQSAVFTVTDWQRLVMLAGLVDRYFRSVNDSRVRSTTLTQVLAEIRQNEALLGATHVDRLKGRIKVERDSGPAGPNAEVAVMADYRRMAEGL